MKYSEEMNINNFLDTFVIISKLFRLLYVIKSWFLKIWYILLPQKCFLSITVSKFDYSLIHFFHSIHESKNFHGHSRFNYYKKIFLGNFQRFSNRKDNDDSSSSQESPLRKKKKEKDKHALQLRAHWDFHSRFKVAASKCSEILRDFLPAACA